MSKVVMSWLSRRCNTPSTSIAFSPPFHISNPSPPRFPPPVRCSVAARRASILLTKKVIATHNGSFHADEALAVYMLRLLPEYKSAKVVRTRDNDEIASADIVVDVGAEYDPARHRYDHHQRDFKETFGNGFDEIKLSSAGLVYKHFGRRIVAGILGWDLEKDKEKLETVYLKIYEDFVLSFDGHDNGVSRYPTDIKPKYRDSTSIGARVGKLNPWWNEHDVDLMERFLKAVELTGTEFTGQVRYVALSWLPAREIVEKDLADRFKIDPSGKIILLSQFCPWKEYLHMLEKETGIKEDDLPLYVIYEDDRAHQYRVQAVAESPESFNSRKALPEPWR
ncbi:metal-dependent protein hydrolase, partial [Blyttiomyces helicus]